tara:strand:+ start:6686 stop:7258 length:573 start_codon:yes stop_codon:yes gene_type:complete
MNNDTFFKLLNEPVEIEDSIEDINKCYISDEVLDDTSVTLECKHSFNYYPLYQEIIKQKHSYRNKLNHLKLGNIECPYCRRVQNKLIPYKKLSGVRRIRGVNSPKEWCMMANRCLVCLDPCSSTFCCKGHDNLYNKCNCMVIHKKTKTSRQCNNKGIFTIKEGDRDIKVCGIHHNQYNQKGISKLNLFKK